MNEHLFAFISEENQSQTIHWLRISPDPIGTGGIYILLYEDLSKKSLYDYWFDNLETAQNWAINNYGIMKSDWRTKQSLLEEGMQIIDEY